ncbi:peptidoglycan-binding protein, partial [Patescibacteria group bacterium]|nr:peptidoglycan-binding protein [Patescibacteria group bacterium]MBU1754812.1 peptidoglycan-binding protein [Patescibacteria group bacterium]
TGTQSSSDTEASTSSISMRGTSIKARVDNLMRLGMEAKARELKAQWPQLFPTEVPIATTSQVPEIDLELGMETAEVRLLQQMLNARGFNLGESGAGAPGEETNYFGQRTRNALARYQAANGITPAVGYFGPLTRAQMSGAL